MLSDQFRLVATTSLEFVVPKIHSSCESISAVSIHILIKIKRTLNKIFASGQLPKDQMLGDKKSSVVQVRVNFHQGKAVFVLSLVLALEHLVFLYSSNFSIKIILEDLVRSVVGQWAQEHGLKMADL